MALRMLLYAARLYEKLLNNENLYKRKQIQVFTPAFIVFYNGTKEQPEHMVQRLSDAFKEKIEHPPLELEVTLYSIRRSGNHIPEILKRCKSLNDYSILIEKIENYREDGNLLGVAIKEAIKECQAKGIMTEYLKAKGSEVFNMLNAEWDWEVAERVWKEEFKEEWMEQGITAGVQRSIKTLMNNLSITAEEAMDLLSIYDADREQYLLLLQNEAS